MFQPLSDAKKSEIIAAILSDDDVELVLNALYDCTPYQIAQWYENWGTSNYIKLYLDFIFGGFSEKSRFAHFFKLACLTFWSEHERLDALEKGTVELGDFLPKDYEEFHRCQFY